MEVLLGGQKRWSYTDLAKQHSTKPSAKFYSSPFLYQDSHCASLLCLNQNNSSSPPFSLSSSPWPFPSPRISKRTFNSNLSIILIQSQTQKKPTTKTSNLLCFPSTPLQLYPILFEPPFLGVSTNNPENPQLLKLKFLSLKVTHFKLKPISLDFHFL